MKALKRSSLIKILAFLLSFVSLVSVAANCALLAYMSYNGLYSNNIDALARKLYNFAAADTADDVYHLVKAKLYAESPNEDTYYWNNEALTYESRLSEEYSNVSFVVSDLDGNVLFSGYDLPDHKYEFAYKYMYHNNDYPDYENATDYDEFYNEIIREPNGNTEVETTTLDYPTETTTVPSAPESTADAKEQQSTTAEATTLPKNTESEEPTTSKETPPAEGKSDNPDAEVSETDNDAFDSFAETARNQHYSYFTVTVLVPECPDTVQDMYTVTSRLIAALFSYKNHIIAVIVVSLVMFICALVLLLSSAGYVKNSEEPLAGGLHKLPFDIALVIVLGITLFAAYLVLDYMYIDNDFALTVALFVEAVVLAVLYLLFIESIAVRIKAKTIFSNNLVVKTYRMLLSAARLIGRNISLSWKTALIFVAISAVDFFVVICAADEFEFGFVLFFILKFIEIPVVFLFAYALSILQSGAKKIADGETNYKVEHKILIGELKKHAESLNSINMAVNKAVEERVKSENMKTELITNVSHDLKTPLTSIVNYIDLLKKTDIENETAKEYVEVIDRQAQRLKKLTTDIVDASKAATGNIEVHFEKTLLNVMLSQINGEYAEALEKRELTLIQQLPENDICVMADGRLLWRVFDNLINNICKYSQSYTRVYMSLVPQGTKAQIIFKNISSTPLNIDSKELTERFVRGDTSRNTEGSGLGLSIAKSLCELMKADFELSIDGDLFKVTITFETIM